MGDVIKLEPVSVGEGYRFDPDEILEAAKGQEFGKLVIIGELPNGDLYLSGSANAGESLIMILRAQQFIANGE